MPTKRMNTMVAIVRLLIRSADLDDLAGFGVEPAVSAADAVSLRQKRLGVKLGDIGLARENSELNHGVAHRRHGGRIEFSVG